MKRALGLLFLVLVCGCSRPSSDSPEPAPSASAPETGARVAEGEAWLLAGTTDERFARAARHLRGFDVAMVETGYRYGELYWAGQDRNWDYATYQLQKIRTAVKNGVERRPKRGQSAQMLEAALPGVEQAITVKDSKLFAEQFAALTAACNACHQVERVPFVHVWPPAVRVSPAGPLASDGGAP